MTVKPGDVIFASVHFDGPPPSDNCGGMFCQEYDTFKVADETTGKVWEQKIACNTADITDGTADCDTDSAEVASQGNFNGNGTADFGQVNFSAIKVTDYKQTGAQAMVNKGWTTVEVVECGVDTFEVDVQPGTLTSTTKPLESAFTNTWERQN